MISPKSPSSPSPGRAPYSHNSPSAIAPISSPPAPVNSPPGTPPEVNLTALSSPKAPKAVPKAPPPPSPASPAPIPAPAPAPAPGPAEFTDPALSLTPDNIGTCPLRFYDSSFARAVSACSQVCQDLGFCCNALHGYILDAQIRRAKATGSLGMNATAAEDCYHYVMDKLMANDYGPSLGSACLVTKATFSAPSCWASTAAVRKDVNATLLNPILSTCSNSSLGCANCTRALSKAVNVSEITAPCRKSLIIYSLSKVYDVEDPDNNWLTCAEVEATGFSGTCLLPNSTLSVGPYAYNLTSGAQPARPHSFSLTAVILLFVGVGTLIHALGDV
eukprot:jgi/Mesen1/5912/ME000030S05175